MYPLSGVEVWFSNNLRLGNSAACKSMFVSYLWLSSRVTLQNRLNDFKDVTGSLEDIYM